jgi:TolB-like protein/Tfp pilus assembly protein PilF
VLRSFGYIERITAEEHAAVRAALERAVEEAPGSADAWAMLSMLYAEEHKHGFNVRPDPLDRALEAARRAVAAAPSNQLAYHVLAQAHFFRRELQEFRNAADRAIALNPMDGGTTAFMGILIGYSGDWEHGCALTERAMQLNPHHPGWYRFSLFHNAYRKGDYRDALDVALKMNMPSYFYTHAALAAAYGQLGERAGAERAVRELLAQKPDFAAVARDEYGKWLGHGEILEHQLDGLRKAGLDIPMAGAETTAPSPASGDGQRARPDSSPPVGDPSGALAIAVLPFSDMSPAKDQQYLCEGMAEEIMNALVRIAGLRVASRTSAFRASQMEKDLATIGEVLSVDQVLEGSVRAAGNRMRVTAQLSDVESGYQVWSERYDRGVEDVFAVQDEIAAGVVDAVKARLTSGEHAVPARPQVKNLEAYRHYLKGRFLRHTKNDHGGALKEYEEAVRLDPSHGPSWVGVAEVNVLAAHYCLVPTATAYAKAEEALATAARLQGESADALYVEGMSSNAQWKWSAGDRAYRRALELAPSHVQVLGAYGLLLSTRHRLDEARSCFERARAADPLASFPCAMTGVGLMAGGQTEESLRHFEDALAFEKENTLALWGSGMAHVVLGRLEVGITMLEQAVAHMHQAAFMVGLLGWALARAGRTDEARRLLEELRARPEPAPTSVSEAWLLAELGDTDAAFDILKRAEEERQAFLIYTGLPGFDPLRADPRFPALLERLGLPTDPGERG